MIIYGTNNFVIKTYSFADLQIADEPGQRHTVELRQRFFHLFFIPFFPIGQTWVVRRAGDSNKYQASASLLGHLNQMGLTQAAPWYSFIGLMLVGVLVIFLAFSR